MAVYVRREGIPLNYIDVLKNDIGLDEMNEVNVVKDDRELWNGLVKSA